MSLMTVFAIDGDVTVGDTTIRKGECLDYLIEADQHLSVNYDPPTAPLIVVGPINFKTLKAIFSRMFAR